MELVSGTKYSNLASEEDIYSCALIDINPYDSMISEMEKEQAKIYDNFVLDKLSQLGYTLDYLKNQDCERFIKAIDADTEEHYFCINDICILGIRQTTSLESEGHKYTRNITLEVI